VSGKLLGWLPGIFFRVVSPPPNTVEVLTVLAVGGSYELLDHIFSVVRMRLLRPGWLGSTLLGRSECTRRGSVKRTRCSELRE
jgi:hypothetical protein